MTTKKQTMNTTTTHGGIIDLDTAFAAPPPYQPSAPPAYGLADKATNTKVSELCMRYAISPHFESALWALNEYHIIFVCDDSGSMNSRAQSNSSAVKTRWQELKEVVGEVFDISLIFDPVGMDVYFLNRQSWLNVRQRDAIDGMFLEPPSGGTPLISKLREINNIYLSGVQSTTRKLVIIATDGEPSDDRAPYTEFKGLLDRMIGNNMHIGFIACTDNESQIEYLNEIDKLYREIDVSDDYWTERRQIQRVQGRNFPFTYGDYVVKALAGPIDNRLDTLDERPLPNNSGQPHSPHHCSIL
jgi:hypothetical protein